MKYIEAPQDYQDNQATSLFLGGGITGCSDWQSNVIKLLESTDLLIYNPRRSNFDLTDKNASKIQIEWEHKYLRIARGLIFWFPAETLCPITLYELGAWSMTHKPMFVGVDQEYQRKFDVETQTRLVRPDIKIVYTLEDIVSQIKERI